MAVRIAPGRTTVEKRHGNFNENGGTPTGKFSLSWQPLDWVNWELVDGNNDLDHVE